MNFKAMYEDQKTFNRLLWDPTAWPDDPNVPESKSLGAAAERFGNRLQHLGLGMVEETLEFLRTYEWKPHRRSRGKLQNVAHSHEELVDMFKYWLSLADLADFPMDNLETLYFEKSRVVKYRYQEEWIRDLNGPTVVVDIDNVLADYITGMAEWMKEYVIPDLPAPTALRLVHRVSDLQQGKKFLNAESLGIEPAMWQSIKHRFRISGGKRILPVFADAKPFLEWCRMKRWTIILITSRPVDRYPNIFTDTITWLTDRQLPFDYLWWASDKAERLMTDLPATMRSQIQFAVDDDPKFIQQYRTSGIDAYRLDRSLGFNDTDPTKGRFLVRSLHDLMARCDHMLTIDSQS